MATLVGWYLKSCCGSCVWLTFFLTFHIRHLYSSSSQVKSKPKSHLPSVYLLPIHAAVAVFSLAAVKCSELHMDTQVVTNCSNPWGTFSYGSTCTFHCPEGQLLNGSSRATCRENGRWSAAMPTCQGTFFICFRTWPWLEDRIPASFLRISHGGFSSLLCPLCLLDECFTMSYKKSVALYRALEMRLVTVWSRPFLAIVSMCETTFLTLIASA